jgi:hypothetical protein
LLDAVAAQSGRGRVGRAGDSKGLEPQQ